MTPIQRIVCTAIAASALGGLVAVSSAEMGPEPTRLPPASELVGQQQLARQPWALPAPTLPNLIPERPRSEQLEQIARQADQRARHGCELAGRGALYAARGELLSALRLLADGLDAERRTDAHGRALNAALTAMREAEDFIPGDARSPTAADVKRLIAAHDTPVLKDREEDIAALSALKSYFTYAQRQFAVAAGEEVAGSMALRALGKLYDSMAEKKRPTETAAATKAMVFYQAALLTQPDNFMAANDLGVLLARAGDYRAAQKMLEYSINYGGHPAAWRNLAVVYRQQGHLAPADWCEHQAMAREQNTNAVRDGTAIAAAGAVRWIDPYSFARTSVGGRTYPSPAGPNAPRLLPAEQTARRGVQGDARGPAPTPAAAQRLTWGTPTR